MIKKQDTNQSVLLHRTIFQCLNAYNIVAHNIRNCQKHWNSFLCLALAINNNTHETKCHWLLAHNIILLYNYIQLYITSIRKTHSDFRDRSYHTYGVYRDHTGLGFLAYPKTSLIFTLWHLSSIGHAKPSSKMSSD